MGMRFLTLAFWLVLTCFLLQGRAQAKDFIVLATPEAPFKYIDNERVRGIDIDVLDQVMNEIGVTYQVRFIRSGARILQEAKNGRADMLHLFSRKPERELFLDYPQESYVSLAWHFFVRAEDQNRIQYNNFKDLLGLQVGATKDFSYTEEFWKAGLALQQVSNNDLQIQKLIGRRIDVVPLNTISTLYELRLQGRESQVSFLPKALKSKPYYNVFPRASSHPDARQVRDRYDAVIRGMKKAGEIRRIMADYLGDRLPEP